MVFLDDALMLARVGEVELAGISLTGIFLWRLSEVVGALRSGTAAYVSRRWGEGDHARGNVAAAHGLFLSGLLGILTAVIVIPLLSGIFVLLGGRDLLRVVVPYTVAVMLAFPFILMRVNLSASMRAAVESVKAFINDCHSSVSFGSSRQFSTTARRTAAWSDHSLAPASMLQRVAVRRSGSPSWSSQVVDAC